MNTGHVVKQDIRIFEIINKNCLEKKMSLQGEPGRTFAQ